MNPTPTLLVTVAFHICPRNPPGAVAARTVLARGRHRRYPCLIRAYALLLGTILLNGSACSSDDGPTAPPPGEVATVSVAPARDTVNAGESVQLIPIVRDGSGNVVPGRMVLWSSSDDAVATVDDTGLVIGIAPGEATITCTSEGKTGTSAITVITPSFDGPKIAFNTNRDGNFEIYLMDPDGAHLVNLTRHAALDVQPTWSPDGTKIAFVSDRDGNLEIYMMNVDGSGVTRLTNYPLDDFHPSWAGSKIAFVRDIGSFPEVFDIFIMNDDGTEAVNVDSINNEDFATAPSLSPDGSRISFTTDRDFFINFTDFSEVYVMNIDGSNPVDLSNHDTAIDEFPEWSPDGRRIAFHTDRDGNFEIYVVESDGSNFVNLTNHEGDDFLPAWSPDGSRIAMQTNRDGNAELYSINVDGTGILRLTNHEAVDAFPAWRP